MLEIGSTLFVTQIPHDVAAGKILVVNTAKQFCLRHPKTSPSYVKKFLCVCENGPDDPKFRSMRVSQRDIVLLSFPFSDLKISKVRPALVLLIMNVIRNLRIS
ncbi:MAG: hypothetical protein KGH88_01060 [Thaumarchaeota archaeon]|nr:hypothetical protein [Nitrososphaerota archaeon]